MINRNNKVDTNTSFNYIIEKGIIKCGICGKNYYSRMRSTGRENSYKCLSERYGNKCGNTNIGVHKLTSAIWYFLKRTEQLKEQLEQTKRNSTLKNDVEVLKGNLIQLKEQLEQQNKLKKKLLNYLMDGIIDKTEFTTKKNEYDSNVNKLEKELQSLNNKINSLIELDRNLDELDDLDDILRTIKETPSELQKVFKKLVRMIKIYPVKECIKTGVKVKYCKDKTVCINLFLNTGIKPIEFLITQQTNLIVILKEYDFNYDTFDLIDAFKIDNRNRRNILHQITIGLK